MPSESLIEPALTNTDALGMAAVVTVVSAAGLMVLPLAVSMGVYGTGDDVVDVAVYFVSQ